MPNAVFQVIIVNCTKKGFSFFNTPGLYKGLFLWYNILFSAEKIGFKYKKNKPKCRSTIYFWQKGRGFYAN